jgi:hypothetical protein
MQLPIVPHDAHLHMSFDYRSEQMGYRKEKVWKREQEREDSMFLMRDAVAAGGSYSGHPALNTAWGPV